MTSVSVKVQLKLIKTTLSSLSKKRFNTGNQLLMQLLKGLEVPALG